MPAFGPGRVSQWVTNGAGGEEVQVLRGTHFPPVHCTRPTELYPWQAIAPSSLALQVAPD